MTGTRTGKAERLNLRLSTEAKRRIEKAASLEGKTATSFIVSSALSQAEETIRNQETMALSRRDAEAFLEALENPPELNAKLSAALKEHQHRVVSR